MKNLEIQQITKLCACGCGQSVNKSSSLYISGHNRRGIKRSSESLQKAKKTNMLRYGVENPFQSKQIQQKIKKIFIEKYGVENPFQSKQIQDKYKQTCIDKYGVNNPSKLNNVKEKSKKTCLIKYGTEFSFQNCDVQKKCRQSMMKNHGVLFAQQCKNIQKKSRKTCFIHFNVYFPSQSFYIINKIRNKCFYQNINWINQSQESRKKARISAIKRIENQLNKNEPMMPTIGFNERIFLDELQKYTQFNIIRNDPSFRYQIGRFPDGHIPELKLFIQFDERHHFIDQECKQYQEDDIRCTKDLESIPGYRVFRVSEREWNENKQKIIDQFKILIESQLINIE